MTIAHRIRRARRLVRGYTIVVKAAVVVYGREARGGLYIFRDCPTMVCVMFARDLVGAPRLVDAALAELVMRLERRRIRNGWPDRSVAA